MSFLYDSPAVCIHPPGERGVIIPACDSLAFFGNATAVFKSTEVLDDKEPGRNLSLCAVLM